MKRWFVIVEVIALLLIPFSVQAQGSSPISVDATDNPLVIRGTLETSPVVSGSLRLTASEDVAAFNFLPSDLKLKDGDEKIARQNISLTGERSLSANTPVDFVVNVSGIQTPGTYEGELVFLLPGQPMQDGLTIKITVEALSKAVLSPLAGSEQLQLGLVNCSWDCWLVGVILPKSTTADARQILLENTGKGDTKVLETGVAVVGQKTGYQLTTQEITLPPSGTTLPAGEINEINIAILRGKIPPDHYTGSLYLTLDGVNERVRIPVDLNVRSGPGIPILLLLLGIVLGRLFKFMQDKGEPQANALQKVNEVAQLIDGAAPQDQKALKAMLDPIRKEVYRMKLEQIEAELKVIESRIEALHSLHEMEASLQDKAQNPAIKSILDLIKEACNLFYIKSDKLAQDKLSEAQTKLEKVIVSSQMGPDSKPDAGITKAGENLSKAIDSSDNIQRLPASMPPSDWLSQLKDFFIRLSGLSSEIRAEATLWFVRPLLYFVLLVGLVIVGLGSFYVDNGATFGSSPFSDYVGIVMWGLSADVASRTLGNLGK